MSRYRTGERIGRGGFGSVYRGVARGAGGFEKPVAIKILDDHAADMVPRLRDEARILAQLHHRAIVHVDDLVELDGRWGVVMELVEGADLAHLLRAGALPPRAACELVGEAAAGLDAVHMATGPDGRSLALVHRDIKPANLRLTPRGEVKILDFGVARADFAAREGATHSGAFGSPGYLAPERHDGVDGPAADVYALGVVLAECLCGKAIGVLSVDRAVHDVHVARIVAALPAAGELVCEMLAYSREARPTAGEVARRLAALVPTLPGPMLVDWAPQHVQAAAKETPVDPPTFGETRLRPSWRWGWPLVIASLGAIAVAAATIGRGLGEAAPGPAPSPRPELAPIVAAPPAPAPPLAIAERSRTRPAPAATRTDEPPEPPPPGLGTLVVVGDADEVRLVGADGSIRSPGEVPAGTWRLVARFGTVEVRPPELVEVREGETVEVRCAAAHENCAVTSRR